MRSKALYKIAAPPEIRSRKRRKVVKEETAERPDALTGPAGDVPMAVDLENIDPTPEQFAEVYCKDLGLGGEFK